MSLSKALAPLKGIRWVRVVLQSVAAAATGYLMFVYAVLIAGGGHGWNSGAMALLALLPVGVCSVIDALRAKPSARTARVLLAIGITIIIVLMLVTAAYDQAGFSRLRDAASEPWVVIQVVLAFVGWIGFAVAAIVRSRSRT